MKKLVIRPYKMASKGAKLLSKTLSDKLGYLVKRVSHTYIPRRNEIVINWGNGKSYWSDSYDANSETKTATNKLEAFEAFKEHGVPSPEWTTDSKTAEAWVNEGHVVVGRKTVTGNSGNGIVLFGGDHSHTLTFCPLYVKYKKKKKEFRAHVIGGKVVEVVEKRKRKGAVHDSKIRNHSNGWVFCRDGVVVPDDLHSVAIAAVGSVGLVFGAVDIIWNEKENKCYALEVNSAPGIEGQTVNQFAEAFVNLFKGV